MLQLLEALLVLPQGPAVVLSLRLVLLVELVVLLLQVLVLVLSTPPPSINHPPVHQPEFKSIACSVLKCLVSQETCSALEIRAGFITGMRRCEDKVECSFIGVRMTAVRQHLFFIQN